MFTWPKTVNNSNVRIFRSLKHFFTKLFQCFIMCIILQGLSQGILLQAFALIHAMQRAQNSECFPLNVDYSSRIRSQTLDKKLNGQYRIWIILVSRRITHLVFPLIFSSRIFSIRWGLSARLQTLTLFLYSNFFTGSYWGIYYL